MNRNAAMKFLLFGCYEIQTVLAVATAMEISITLQLPWEFVSPKEVSQKCKPASGMELPHSVVLSRSHFRKLEII